MALKRKQKDIYFLVEMNKAKYLLPYLTSVSRLTGVNIHTLRYNIKNRGYYLDRGYLVEKIAVTKV